uniref:Uncharacterized protein n=1 Tax=Strongyloides papillosus TaxID=174720 RepID=A0A0N5BEV7_STREA
MKRMFNFNREPAPPLPIIPITIHDGRRSKNNKLKKNGLFTSSKYSKFLIRNLPEEDQREARQRLNEFIRQPLDGIDARVASNQSGDSDRLSEFVERARDFSFRGREVPQRPRHSYEERSRKTHIPQDAEISNSEKNICPEGFVIPKVPVDKRLPMGKRKHPLFRSEENELNQRERAILERDGVFPKKSVRFSDSDSETSANLFPRRTDNARKRESFLRDSTNDTSTEDLFCSEISPVTKMLEKQRTMLNNDPIRSAEPKKKKKREWRPEMLESFATNLSEGLPPLTLNSKTPMTYNDALKSTVKMIFTNIEQPDPKSESTRKVSDSKMTTTLNSIFEMASPFVNSGITVSQSRLEETLNLNFSNEQPDDPDNVSFEFEDSFHAY